jgi:YesN/AraC family two-component response regulator
MKNVLIVDDDTIIRITLRSLINWEEMGYRIIADAIHGQQALEILKKTKVDLLITDMKMPVLDGIGLLEQLNREDHIPAVIVLSGYDDFKLVREAFRLGAYDYLLKADLNEEIFTAMIKKMEEEVFASSGNDLESIEDSSIESRLLADMAVGKRELKEDFFSQDYLVIQFEIEDFQKVSMRFGENIEEELMKPMLEFAGQIPRVAARCVLGAISPSRYVMMYRIFDTGQYRENAVSTCKQLSNVWNNYMNLTVAAGISTPGKGSEEFLERFEEAGQNLRLHYLKGKMEICTPWEHKTVTYEQVCKAGKTYKELLTGLMTGDELSVQEEKKKLFSDLYREGLEQAKCICLYLVCNLAWLLQENHDDIHSLFPDEVNYYEKIGRLQEMRNLELWVNNYFRWILDYSAHQSDRRQADMMIRAKRFIQDNYANPELTLGSVAGYIGLNEKYFSSRFTKEEGTTFSNYLTEVRISKARGLMETTDLKIYEISQNVGYNSVEHFTRMFNRLCKVSPGSYRK